MRVIIDSSVWVDHLKGTDTSCRDVLLSEGTVVLSHSMVFGELMLGGVKRDTEVFTLLQEVPKATEPNREEALLFIEGSATNKGVGYVDSCILASCILSNAALMTRDENMIKLAGELNISLL